MAKTEPLRLLVVEDHPMTRMGIQLTLEQDARFSVVGQAVNGQQAVTEAAELTPDVILMDIGLPEMDGIEATQRIKAVMPDTRILMLTSKDNEQDVLAALAAGADGYCMKGTEQETLFNAIVAVNEGAAWLDPTVARIVMSRIGQPATNTTTEAPAGRAIDPSLLPSESPLTPREMEVLQLIVDGHSNPDIAEKLVITKATAKAHVHSILQKLCVDDRTQAAVLAMRSGLVAG